MALHGQPSLSNLSDISGLTDMSDVSSSTDLTEARVCMVTECSAPYGPACRDCAEAFRIHEKKRARAKAAQIVWQRSHQDLPHWRRDWDDAKNAERSYVPALPNAHMQQSTTKSKFPEPSAAQTSHAQLRGSGDLPSKSVPCLAPRWSKILRTETSSSRLSMHSRFSKIEVDRAWFAEYLENPPAVACKAHDDEGPSLAVRRVQPMGSWAEQHAVCPFCRGRVGDPRGQHVRKCEYAHLEQKTLDSLQRKQAKVSTGWAPPLEVPHFFDWTDVDRSEE